jgi:hypothetical protein
MPKSHPSQSRARTGKIARLPNALREQLNERLLNGEAGAPLGAWLNSLPEVQSVLALQFKGVPIREQNLSEWRKGGYQTWLESKAFRQDLTEFQETVLGLQGVAQDGLTNQLAFFLAAQLVKQLKRLESVPEGEQKAKVWRELTAALVALRRGDLEQERIRVQQEKLGLRKKTQPEREAEFWKWAEENIHRDEFCRRRCFTAEEREEAMDKILGLTPAERRETVPPDAAAPRPSGLDPALVRPNPT